MLQQRLLEFQNITKRFGGTTALRDVTLHLETGEVLALLGENGAACVVAAFTPRRSWGRS